MLCEKLKKLRSSTNLTQSQFAKKIDVARTTYAMYEQGNREPDYETLCRIADYYGVSIDFLLGRTDSMKQQKDSADKTFEQFVNSPDLQTWYKELPENDEEELRQLKEIWEIIKKKENEK